MLFVSLYSIASPVVETVLGDRQNYVEGKTALVPLAAQIDGAADVVVPVVAIVVTFFILVFRRFTGVSLLLVIAPGLVLTANEFVHGRPPTFGLLITSAVGALLVSVRVKFEDLVVIAYVGAAVAGASLLAMSVDPSKVLISGGVALFEKSLTGAPLLAGIFTHSNIFGMFLALSLPFSLLARRVLVRLALLSLMSWTLVLTSSRTALAGAVVAVLVLLLVFVLPRIAFAAITTAGLVAAAVAEVWLPLTETDPDAYTYRGAIWIFNRQQLGDHWLFGLGAHWYADNYPLLRDVLSSAASHAHNFFLTTLVMGGAVVLLAWAVLIVTGFFTSLRRPSRNEQAVGASFVLGLLVIGATETPFGLLGWGPLSTVAIVPLFVLAGQRWLERDERVFAAELALSGHDVPVTRAMLRGRRGGAADRGRVRASRA